MEVPQLLGAYNGARLRARNQGSKPKGKPSKNRGTHILDDRFTSVAVGELMGGHLKGLLTFAASEQGFLGKSLMLELHDLKGHAVQLALA
jgi:hypothetical protein